MNHTTVESSSGKQWFRGQGLANIISLLYVTADQTLLLPSYGSENPHLHTKGRGIWVEYRSLTYYSMFTSCVHPARLC